MQIFCHPQDLNEHFGWPLKIQARDCIAHLVGAQALDGGELAPIYRFPGGDSLVSECEMIPADGD